jgi:rare lipoprotein A
MQRQGATARHGNPLRSAGVWFALVLLAWLAGCAGAPDTRMPQVQPPRPAPQKSVPQKPVPQKPAPSAVPAQTRPYAIDGKWYQPLASADGYSETGLASWYGKKFHGRPTASGEPYDMYALSAAHKTLPLQTWVQVHNLDTDRQVDLRINDRGPFVGGRIIDLSYGAARKLGVVEPGTARVKITALGRRTDTGQAGQAPRYTPMDYTHGNFTFQVGAFKEPENANRLRDRLAGAYQNVHITTYFHADYGQLYAVRLGRASTLDEAAAYKAKLRAGEFGGAFTVAE